MDLVALAASRIIKEQQAIIGPVALEQARKVAGLQVGGVDDVKVTGSGKEVLASLVNQYAKLFGQASVEVCKEAIAPMADKLPSAQIPEVLM